MTTEYVALVTFANEDAGTFYEAGGIYSEEPVMASGRAARKRDPNESIVTCQRCGQRFAATDDGTPESHRDLHFNGDNEIPSICA